jgi:hypothetical protein
MSRPEWAVGTENHALHVLGQSESAFRYICHSLLIFLLSISSSKSPTYPSSLPLIRANQSRTIMPRTRSKKHGPTVHPYKRSLDRERCMRETSFTDWKGMNDAAIIRATETLNNVSETFLLLQNGELT